MLMCKEGFVYPDLQEAVEAVSLTAHLWGVRMTPTGFEFKVSEHLTGPRYAWHLERLDVLTLDPPGRRPAPLAPTWAGGHLNLRALRGCLC